MFRDLDKRVANPLDDGRVEGNMSLADKSILKKENNVPLELYYEFLQRCEKPLVPSASPQA